MMSFSADNAVALRATALPAQAQHTGVAVVMLVDDDAMVTESLGAFLTLETPHQVHTFNCPLAALKALEDDLKPDVVISDFLMPELNGIDFLQRVRAKFPYTTCMLLTGYADKENAIEGINKVGLYRYIEKPWDNADVAQTLENGIERARLVARLQHTVTDLAALTHQLEDRVAQRTQALRQLTGQLQAVWHSTADGMAVLNAQGAMTSVNPTLGAWLTHATQASTGSPLPAWRHWSGEPFTPCLDAAQQPAFKALLEQCLNQGKVFRFDITLGDQWLEAILSPLQPAPLEGDEPLLTPIIPQRDEPQAVKVSAEALPAEAASLSDEKPPCFEAAVLTLRDVTAQRETERLREDFVSTLTHDLRTPLLAAIQTFGFFQDGSLGPLAQRQQQMMSLLQDSHRDLLGLVNTLLEVYKYEANQQRLVKTQLNLLELAKTVVAELAPLAQSKGQTLRLDADTSIPLQCRADRQELRRVLMNLVGNAIHHTPGAGEITLAVDKQAAMMRLRVLDTGPGIPKVDCAKLFQRFSQGTSRKRNSGTGLGLYLSRQIVEAHGGRIAVASEEGAGSCFTVQLPV